MNVGHTSGLVRLEGLEYEGAWLESGKGAGADTDFIQATGIH